MRLRKDITALRAAARAELDAIFARRMEAILGPFERLHTRKAGAARRVEAGEVSTMLSAEAAKLTIDPADLAGRVLAKAEAQDVALGALEAERQAAQAAIEAAANPIELDAILTQHRGHQHDL